MYTVYYRMKDLYGVLLKRNLSALAALDARRADFMFLVSHRRSSIKQFFFDSPFLNSQVNSSTIITKHRRLSAER